jgi:hypothetical protein
LVLGLASLALRDRHHYGVSFSSVAWRGLYTQSWGMAALPLAVGAFRRAVVADDGAGRMTTPTAAIVFAVCGMSHLFVGLYAGWATLAMVLARPSAWRRRAVRAAQVWGLALVVMGFWLVPLVATRDLTGGLPWPNPTYAGFAPTEAARAILGGDLFDHDRFPLFTICAIAAACWALRSLSRGEQSQGEGSAEQRERVRWICGLGAATALLWLGRTTFGPVYDAIPFHAHINVMRYTIGIHFCALVLVAMAAGRTLFGASPFGASSPTGGRMLRAAVSLGAAVAVMGYAAERHRTYRGMLRTFDAGGAFGEVARHLSEGPEHRFAVAERFRTDSHFFRDLLPALADRGQLQSYALGFHATHSTYYAEYLRTDPDWLALFDIGALVAREPFVLRPGEDFEVTLRAGRYRVFAVPGREDFQIFGFVRTPVTLHGGLREIRPAVRATAAELYARGVLPVLSGESRARPTFELDGVEHVWEGHVRAARREVLGRIEGRAIASRVLDFERGLAEYRARVDAGGDGERLVLKVNYFPFWRATVDGHPVEITHVAPNFMAIDVPAGRREVRFRYRNPPLQKVGALASLLLALGWLLGRVVASMRRRKFVRRAVDPPEE